MKVDPSQKTEYTDIKSYSCFNLLKHRLQIETQTIKFKCLHLQLVMDHMESTDLEQSKQ